LFRIIAPQGLSMRVACLPEGDDPDTYIKAHGVDAFRAMLAEAKEFFDFKLENARAGGLLDQPATRNAVVKECAEILAGMSEMAARENAINSVVAHLQMSSQALRDEVLRIRKRPQRAAGSPAPAVNEGEVEPTPMNRIVAYLCQLALTSATAQHFLAEQFETLHEAAAWLEGVPLLESILAAAPDCSSPAAVNAYLGTLGEADRMALLAETDLAATTEEDGLRAAEHSLALLSGIVLQRRDAAIKSALKEPGISNERMFELLEQAKEIAHLLRGMDQRCEFDDELPKSTFKPKEPEWKKRWRQRQGEG